MINAPIRALAAARPENPVAQVKHDASRGLSEQSWTKDPLKPKTIVKTKAIAHTFIRSYTNIPLVCVGSTQNLNRLCFFVN